MNKYELLTELNYQILNGSKSNIALSRIVVKRLRDAKRIESIKDIVRESSLSIATIYRFAIVLGFESFILLKSKFNKLLEKDTEEDYVDDFYFAYPQSAKDKYLKLLDKSSNIFLSFGDNDFHIKPLVTKMFKSVYDDKIFVENYNKGNLLIAINLNGESRKVKKDLLDAEKFVLFSKKDIRPKRNPECLIMSVVSPYHSGNSKTRNFLDTSLIVAIANLLK